MDLDEGLPAEVIDLTEDSILEAFMELAESMLEDGETREAVSVRMELAASIIWPMGQAS